MSQSQRALIIGASKGIGLAVVQQFLQAGWDVTATFRRTAVSYQHERLRWLALHPGWVKTDMGGENADITAEESAAGLVTQLQRYRGEGGHHYLDYKGDALAW